MTDAHRPAPRALLSIDDGGEWLVVAATRATLGHSRAGDTWSRSPSGSAAPREADIGLLADVEPRHLELVLVETFHGGAAWQVEVTAARAVQLLAPDPVTLEPGARATLVDGTRVVLAPKLAFVFRAPDPGSATACLHLEHGHEAGGASRVLLLAPGRAGRALVSAARHAHVRVAGLALDVELEVVPTGVELRDSTGVELRDSAGVGLRDSAGVGAAEPSLALIVRCEGGVSLVGGPAPAPGGPRVQRVPLPPAPRLALAVGARAAPPFQIAVAPVGA